MVSLGFHFASFPAHAQTVKHSPHPLSRPGIVCALGTEPRAVWKGALSGISPGMRRCEGVLPEGASCPFGFVDLPDENALSAADRCTALLFAAAEQIRPELEALLSHTAPERIGVVLGTSNSTMEEFTVNPVRIDMATPAHALRARLGLAGPAFSISTACSSGAKAFASARRLLEADICDAVLVGGTDSFSRIVLCGFHALESIDCEPMRPFGLGRAGINLGEGAALFILYRAGDAPLRLLGIGESSDAYHLTAPHPEGLGAEDAMRAALSDAGLAPADIGYINLHGTGTPLNDRMESLAVSRVFGLETPCSSTKPLTGHTLGAAGAVEAALSALMLLQDGDALLPHFLPGERDPALPPLHLVSPGERAPVRAVLSNSFAFGGSNAALVLAKA